MHGPLADLKIILGRNNYAETSAAPGSSTSHDTWSERLRSLQIAHFDFSFSTKNRSTFTFSSP